MPIKHNLTILVVLFLCAASAHCKTPNTIYLDSFDLKLINQGYGDAPAQSKLISINEKRFEHGIGTHAYSSFLIDLHGTSQRFSALVGAARKAGEGGTVVFHVIGDGKKLWQSPMMKAGDDALPVDVDVSGIKLLDLIVTDANDGSWRDHAVWADAKLTYTGQTPEGVIFKFQPYILTPKASHKPSINGAKIFGVKPGRPFLYTIPASGRRPMVFGANDLPEGLNFDSTTGRITGSIDKTGEYKVMLTVSNKLGKDKCEFKIVCGDTICLTPPLGWNSWNCWGCAVDETKIRKAAEAMVASGLINHGWTYINIDDCWHGGRDKDGKITSNERFPDMKAFADYIHSLGLKIGLYTDCGPKTCAGYMGSEGHELDDVMTYAEWGFDYVKVDWCYCEGKDPAETYTIFGNAVSKIDRDIIFSICEWGNGKPWLWGEKSGGNCWRTTGDIIDTWASVYSILCQQVGLSQYAKPGHWNDPDMLVVGEVGWGPTLRQARLTADEQYTHISLWCLLSSPLLIGCDMTQMDDFTLNLLTNDEVLAINQDALGEPAKCVLKTDSHQIWRRNLEDCSKAVGLVNITQTQKTLTLNWSDIGVHSKQILRNVWTQSDIGIFENKFEISVPRHGTILLKLTPVK